jgi:hypothetical protein
MGQDHHIECTSLLCLRSETLVSVLKWDQDYWYKQMSESVCLYQITHSTHSTTSRLLTSSLFLGVPVVGLLCISRFISS